MPSCSSFHWTMPMPPPISNRSPHGVRNWPGSIPSSSPSCPQTAAVDALPTLPFPVLRDDGQVRASYLPEVAPDVLAMLVTRSFWRGDRVAHRAPCRQPAGSSTRRSRWAWEVARPKGSCGGVTWALTANPVPPPPPPAPDRSLRIGAHPRNGYHRGRRSGSRFEVRGRQSQFSRTFEPRTRSCTLCAHAILLF